MYACTEKILLIPEKTQQPTVIVWINVLHDDSVPFTAFGNMQLRYGTSLTKTATGKPRTVVHEQHRTSYLAG
jgi:hypothetical protein